MTTYTDYPTPTQIAQLDGSQLILQDDLTVTRSANGTAHARALYPVSKKGFRVLHLMTDEEWADYLTFYDTYRGTFFAFVFAANGTSYPSVCFSAPPQFSFSGTNVQVEAMLLEQ